MCNYILIKNGDKGKFSEKGFRHCGVATPTQRGYFRVSNHDT